MEWKMRPRGEYVVAVVKILDVNYEMDMQPRYCEFIDLCRDQDKLPTTCAQNIVEGTWEQLLSEAKAAATVPKTSAGSGTTSTKSAGRAGQKPKAKAKPTRKPQRKISGRQSRHSW